jgi:hypothetical protein
MPLQMQGMDRKYDGHAWCKVITINIRIYLVLVLGKLIARVTCDVYKTIVKTLCALVLTMKYSSAMSAHIFQSCVRWHCLHSLPPLHANFIIFFLCVWRIVSDKFIMLCIDYHQYLEWRFISGSTSILWQMASERSLWTRLKG